MSLLVLEGLSCDDLYDTGSWNDTQDPAIRLVYNKQIFMTERSKDTGKSGKSMHFTFIYMLFIDLFSHYSSLLMHTHSLLLV